MTWHKSVLIFAVVTLAHAGCGSGRFPVEGTIAFPDGEPLTKGELIFDDGTYSDFAAINTEGRFVVAKGLPPGTYKVLVLGGAQGQYEGEPGSLEPPKPPKPLVDGRYFQADTTDLEVVVGKTKAAIQLTVDRPDKK